MTTSPKLKNNQLKDILKFGGLGLLLGVLLVIAAEIKFSYMDITNMQQRFMEKMNGNSETQYLIAKAQYMALTGQNQEVINILSPNLQKFTNRYEAAKANGLLGTAEYQLGHPLLAAGYFELMYVNSPSSENLYKTALAYDAGGNLNKALEKFELAISANDGSLQYEEIAYAQQRIHDIQLIKKPSP
jgi:tetratricopeptide (TPR) repeat protein